jgi:hypothetical protein
MAAIDHHDDIRFSLKTPATCGWHHGEMMTPQFDAVGLVKASGFMVRDAASRLLVLARPVIVGAFRKERPTPGGRPEWVAGRRIERS